VGHYEGVKGRCAQILTRSVLALRAALRVRLPVCPLTPSPFQNRTAAVDRESGGAGSRARPEAACGAEGLRPEHRTGEDGGEAEPLTLNRSGKRSSGGVQGLFSPAPLPRGERGVWGSAPRCAVGRAGNVTSRSRERMDADLIATSRDAAARAITAADGVFAVTAVQSDIECYSCVAASAVRPTFLVAESGCMRGVIHAVHPR